MKKGDHGLDGHENVTSILDPQIHRLAWKKRHHVFFMVVVCIKMMSSTLIQPHPSSHAVCFQLKVSAGQWNVELFDYAGWTWRIRGSTRHRLCLCALLLLANVFSWGVMEGFPIKFLCPRLQKTRGKKAFLTSTLINLRKSFMWVYSRLLFTIPITQVWL